FEARLTTPLVARLAAPPGVARSIAGATAGPDAASWARVARRGDWAGRAAARPAAVGDCASAVAVAIAGDTAAPRPRPRPPPPFMGPAPPGWRATHRRPSRRGWRRRGPRA